MVGLVSPAGLRGCQRFPELAGRGLVTELGQSREPWHHRAGGWGQKKKQQLAGLLGLLDAEKSEPVAVCAAKWQ